MCIVVDHDLGLFSCSCSPSLEDFTTLLLQRYFEVPHALVSLTGAPPSANWRLYSDPTLIFLLLHLNFLEIYSIHVMKRQDDIILIVGLLFKLKVFQWSLMTGVQLYICLREFHCLTAFNTATFNSIEDLFVVNKCRTERFSVLMCFHYNLVYGLDVVHGSESTSIPCSILGIVWI